MLKYFSLILLGYPLLAFASTDVLDDKPAASQPSLSATSAESSITSTDSFNKPAENLTGLERLQRIIERQEQQEQQENMRIAKRVAQEEAYKKRTGKWPWSDGRAFIWAPEFDE